MPVVTTATITIRGKEDGTIDIILDEVNRCGCVSVQGLSKVVGAGAGELEAILSALTTKNLIACDSGICCADRDKLTEFTKKLARLKKET